MTNVIVVSIALYGKVVNNKYIKANRKMKITIATDTAADLLPKHIKENNIVQLNLPDVCRAVLDKSPEMR